MILLRRPSLGIKLAHLRMRVLVLIAFLSFLPSVSEGQEVRPLPETGRSQPVLSGPRTRAVPADLPLPDGDTGPRDAPSVLPESSLLPSAQAVPLPAPDPPLTPEQKKENARRIADARLSAMRNPRLISLLNEAKAALTPEARRNYLRAYFITLCTQMRRTAPDLRAAITSFERDQVRKIARTKNLAVTNSGLLAD